MERYIEKLKVRGVKFENKKGFWPYLALCFFVAIPLPGTGAWSGSLLAWIFGFNRKASFLAISIGVLFAGLIVLLLSLGVFGFFY